MNGREMKEPKTRKRVILFVGRKPHLRKTRKITETDKKKPPIQHLSIHDLNPGNDSVFQCAVQTVACRQLRLRLPVGCHKVGSYRP
jgi:hypothetical protein